jgi:hypothetical protein
MIVQLTTQKYIDFLQRTLNELEAEKSQLLIDHKASHDTYISHIEKIRDTLFRESAHGDLRFDRIYIALCNARDQEWVQLSFLDKLLHGFNVERLQVWVRRGLAHDSVNCSVEDAAKYIMDEILEFINIFDDFSKNPRAIPPVLYSLEYEMRGILQNFGREFAPALTKAVRDLSTIYTDVIRFDNRIKKTIKEINDINQTLDNIKALDLENETLSIDINSEIYPV